MQGQQIRVEGRPVDLVSNMFHFKTLPIKTIYGYFIEYTPDVDINNQDLKKFLVRQAQEQITQVLGHHYYYDFIIAKIKTEDLITVSVEGRDGTQYILAIRYVSAIDPESDQFSWYLNILIKLQQRGLGLKQLTKKPTFFNSDQAVEMRSIGLSIWNGYKATINSIGSQILMTLDICSKIINNKNVLEAMEEIKENNPEVRRRRILELLLNQIVMTLYNKRFYRVLSIDYESTPDSYFETKQGKVSFREYMLSQYNIQIQNPRQPLLVAVQRNVELKLIPELCYLTGIPERAKRDGNIMRQVRDANRSNPNDRQHAIQNHIEKMASGRGLELAETHRLVADVNPVIVHALELKPVKILLKNEAFDCTDRGFNIRNGFKAAVPMRLLRILHHNSDYNNANFLEKSLTSRFKACGVILENVDYDEYSTSRHLMDLLQSARSSSICPDIIVIILQRRDKTYEDLKQLSVTLDLPIQCILSSQFRNERKVESVLTNLAHQIAAKTGSQLWSIPHCEGIPKITMVVGMDVFHDTVNKKESVLGFSASLNPEFTRYYSTIRKQSKIGEEISASVDGCFKEALVAFFEETKRRFLPNLIVVFRDGVSESQEEYVRDIELAGLKKIISGFERYNPEIVYMVVCKRIDQRFFLANNGNFGNPRAGTCVTDPVVCDENTFYLITSNVTQGTATPVKYKLIENSSNISKEVLAKFSFGLSHLYYNWKGAIKLPAPTQLSHKLALMVGESVHKDSSFNLKKTLWYL